MYPCVQRAAGLFVVLGAWAAASAQSPIQWSGSVPASVERAREQTLPLMFWVTEGMDLGDDDDLRDAQESCFRDPTVVAIAQNHFVPVRVSRNSRVMEAAEKFGLPTAHGLYVALITPEGELLGQIGPGELTESTVVAQRLTAIYRGFRDAMYQREFKPLISDLQAPKVEVRRAVQTVWRLNTLSADADLVGLLNRSDLTPPERRRLYAMFASFATPACIDALLTAAGTDPEAAKALLKAEPGALETLLGELPADGSAVAAEGLTPRQLNAYKAAARLARLSAPRPDTFWAKADAQDREKALQAVRQRAEPVLAYWQENIGAWR